MITPRNELSLNPARITRASKIAFCAYLLKIRCKSWEPTAFYRAFLIPLLVRLISVPSKLISPVVVTLCFIGAFAASNEVNNLYVMLLGGLAGYFMNKYDYPTAPMLLAFVLTPTIEKNLYRTLMVNNGSLSIFWERPITLGLLIATAALMVAPVVLKAVRKGKKAEAQQ